MDFTGEEAGIRGDGSQWKKSVQKISGKERNKLSLVWGEQKDLSKGLPNVVIRFDDKGGVKKINPLKLRRIVRDQIGEV